MTHKPHVTFYTKPGCHLCDEAKREILKADCADDYTFEEVDIETDAGLKARFGWDIPVVRIDDIMAFKHRLTADEFKHAVESKVRGEGES